MASKNLASKSASAIAEILGIAPDPSTAPSAAASGSATPYSGFSSTPFPSTPYEPGPSTSASPTPAPTPAELKLQELTVSSKSVMDYFKDKLAAKSNAASGAATPVSPRDEELDDYADRPRVGLGASRLRLETTVEETQEVRGGLGGIGSGSRMQFAAMFAKASTTATVTTEVVAVQSTEVETAEVDAPETRKEKKSKKEKKDKKGKEKEGAEDEDAADAALDAGDGTDEKAERKRRKEEKRRRKEAEALAASAQETAEADLSEKQQQRKRKKDKRKSKGDS